MMKNDLLNWTSSDKSDRGLKGICKLKRESKKACFSGKLARHLTSAHLRPTADELKPHTLYFLYYISHWQTFEATRSWAWVSSREISCFKARGTCVSLIYTSIFITHRFNVSWRTFAKIYLSTHKSVLLNLGKCSRGAHVIFRLVVISFWLQLYCRVYRKGLYK